MRLEAGINILKFEHYWPLPVSLCFFFSFSLVTLAHVPLPSLLCYCAEISAKEIDCECISVIIIRGHDISSVIILRQLGQFSTGRAITLHCPQRRNDQVHHGTSSPVPKSDPSFFLMTVWLKMYKSISLPKILPSTCCLKNDYYQTSASTDPEWNAIFSPQYPADTVISRVEGIYTNTQPYTPHTHTHTHLVQW